MSTRASERARDRTRALRALGGRAWPRTRPRSRACSPPGEVTCAAGGSRGRRRQGTTSGGLREWTHADVHIAIEPTEAGSQLRITARNEAAVALNGLGIVTGGMSLLMLSLIHISEPTRPY